MKAKQIVFPLFFMTSSAAFGNESAGLDSGNAAWILISSALVLMMTLPGLALFYGGLVRVKNVLSVLMQCFVITCAVSILWMVCGYSLAFDSGTGWIGGLNKALFANITRESMTGNLPEILFALFQLTFAVITPALIVGSFAERMKFSSMLLFSVVWSLIVYSPVAHWVWGGGWLAQRGFLDFAGGTVVHITAGIASLVAALYMGPRNGFMKVQMPPHNMTMTVTGAGLLWVGWYGFNGGSALAANGNAAMAIVTTHLSASMGALTWMTLEWVRFGKPSALGIVTGMVAGLGTITPASGFVGPAGALVIGFLGGLTCFFATLYIKRHLKIDDSLDVFPVHGIGGILGTLLTGVFSSPDLGVLSGYGFGSGIENMAGQLKVQLLGVIVTILFTAVLSYMLFFVIEKFLGLRVDEDSESQGLDLSLHEERGYDL